ncbi:MAG: hypothetical protein Kapaf2KO_18860 [Candidatus Kapaibacteriales bacterium]
MSKGGAGKVYFVLYLAVVLELLIIIVERDEAEEHLHAKQKETMKIVQSILSQLQSGSGTEGVNTRPQDEITMTPAGMSAAEIKEAIGTEIKSNRKYVIEVGVADVSQDAKPKEGENPKEKEYLDRIEKLIEISNVAELQYQIFYSPSTEIGSAPQFPEEAILQKENINEADPGARVVSESGEVWELLSTSVLNLDMEQTIGNVDMQNPAQDAMHPVYNEIVQNGPVLAPNDIDQSQVFYYDPYETVKGKIEGSDTTGQGKLKSGVDKRAFVVNFLPPSGKDGWYKLRFDARTNRILGIKKQEGEFEVSDDATVNIGTVQLKVKDLAKVQKQLLLEIDKYGLPKKEDLKEDAENFDRKLAEAKQKAMEEGELEHKNKIQLYGYITKLITPGQSVNFDQNKGAIEFDIRVNTPKPEIAPPGVTMPNEFNRFDALEPTIEATIANYNKNNSNLQGYVYDAIDGENSSPVATIQFDQIQDEGVKNFRVTGKTSRKLEASPNGGPKKYIVKILHQAGSKKDETTASLFVYPTVSETANSAIDKALRNYAYYGDKINLNNFEPPSGNKIKPNEFTIRFQTDNMGQPKEVEGIAVSRDDDFYFPCEAKTASLSVYWTDPVTSEKVYIYPEKTLEIKQYLTIVNTARATAQAAVNGDNIAVQVTNISVFPSKNGKGSDDEADVKLNVNVEAQVKGEAPYRATNVSHKMVGDNKMTVTFLLQGPGPDDDGRVRGDATVSITAVSVNKCNGKTSVGDAPISYSVPISVKMETDQYYDEY